MRFLEIDELADELELMFWEKGIENFRITELFPNCGVNVYDVNRLVIEHDRGMVYSHDTNNVILNGMYVLMTFLKKCVISIRQTIINGIIVCMLEFRDGDITIEAI